MLRTTAAATCLGLITLGLTLAPSPATSRPIDKGHFHESETNFFTCQTTHTPTREDVDLDVNFLFNQRGSSAFPYYKENVRGSVTWTNLDNDGTFTNVFSVVRADHNITDNGDGTATIETWAAGGSKYYDNAGNQVLLDPGTIRFAFEVDYNGTPGNPDDDSEVDGSFRVIRESTGRTDTTGDFCTDLVKYSSVTP